MTDFHQPLATLRQNIETLAEQSPHDAAKAWRQLQSQVEMICKHLENADPAIARATLPDLGDLIRLMDQVVARVQQNQT
jgi:hypothetical protein